MSGSTDPITRARQGDPNAWSELLVLYGPALYSLCRRLALDPDDAYQDLWEKVHMKIGQFDPARSGSFRGWLLTLAHRQLIDRHRREKARTIEVIDDPLQSEPQVDREIALRERWTRVEAALCELPVEERRALLMYHIEERPIEEIAAFEGIPQGTVKSRLHRARCRLIERMRGKDEP